MIYKLFLIFSFISCNNLTIASNKTGENSYYLLYCMDSQESGRASSIARGVLKLSDGQEGYVDMFSKNKYFYDSSSDKKNFLKVDLSNPIKSNLVFYGVHETYNKVTDKIEPGLFNLVKNTEFTIKLPEGYSESKLQVVGICRDIKLDSYRVMSIEELKSLK